MQQWWCGQAVTKATHRGCIFWVISPALQFKASVAASVHTQIHLFCVGVMQ